MEEYRARPNIEGKTLDFSEFHDLMHSLRYCPDRRTHLKYAWRYKWSMELRAMTWCKLGLHRPGQMWKRDRDTWSTAKACTDCAKRMTEFQPE